MSDTFGQRLRQERERAGLTQEQFATLAGMSRLAQYKYETGQSQPSVEYLAALHQAHVDAYYLLTGQRLSSTQIDWGIAKEAFNFVHKHFTTKPGKSYTADQLFEVFQRLLMTMMDESTSVSTPTQTNEDVSTPAEER